MQTAYDPARIRDLSSRTVVAIDALAALGSTDPAAADAIRAVRLLRRNLEDLWMPLLREIESSRAMIAWAVSAAGSMTALVHDGRQLVTEWIIDHRDPNDPTVELEAEFRAMTDDEFVDRLAWLVDVGLPFDGHGDLDLEDGMWTTTFPTLAAEMARRVVVDPSFAGRMVAIAPDNPLVALAVGSAAFPSPFARDVVVAMLQETSWSDDFQTRVEARAVSTVLTELGDHPVDCLSVLSDRRALEALASWPFLDQEVVASFVHSGLYRSVVEDPAELRAGYAVLASLTGLANSALDDGFMPGMARGVANSMIGYVDTLGRAIGTEDGGDVRVTTLGEHAFTCELGTYEQVRNLFGAIARDVEAQASLGVVLGAYMNTVVETVGSDVGERSGVGNVAQFADLIADAVTTEQAEMIAAAAADTAKRGLLAGAIGFAASTIFSTFGPTPIVSFAVGQIINEGTARIMHVDAEVMPNGRLRHVAYDSIIVATVSLARSDAATRAAHDLDEDDADSLERIDGHLAHLAELDAIGDADAYHDEVSDMADDIAQSAPRLDVFLNDVLSNPAVSELTESHD